MTDILNFQCKNVSGVIEVCALKSKVLCILNMDGTKLVIFVLNELLQSLNSTLERTIRNS